MVGRIFSLVVFLRLKAMVIEAAEVGKALIADSVFVVVVYLFLLELERTLGLSWVAYVLQKV
jgi:hypothetical protein